LSVSDEVDNPGSTDRRIEGIQFNEDGSFKGLLSASETKNIELRFDSAPTTIQTIAFTMGTDNAFDGLTQFAAEEGKSSTAAAKQQDGYTSGKLSSLSVNNEGKVVGTFSNGVKKDIAAIQLTLFQNPAGLESVGSGYYVSTENSGEAIGTMALNGGAGSVQGKSLEKSNVDTANEFVQLMQAQNGFQANARTIRVANDVLRELTNLIR
jgi:flagellar hook protein FlgE